MHKLLEHLSRALICAYAIALPDFAEADNFDYCPEIWSDYVQLVRDLIASGENEMRPVLFIGTSGQVHNCLSESIDHDLLAQVNSYHNATSRLFEGNLDGPSSEWPTNVCSVGDVQNPVFSYLIVGLPYSSDILSKDICRVRIENSLTHRNNANWR